MNDYESYNTEEIDAYKSYVGNGDKLLLLADFIRRREEFSLVVFAGARVERKGRGVVWLNRSPDCIAVKLKAGETITAEAVAIYQG